MTAAAYAARHPGRVAAVVLGNPTARTTAAAAAMLRQRAEAVRMGGMAAILPQVVERAFLGQPADDRYERYLARFAAQDPEGYASAIEGVLDADVGDELRMVACPSLVVAGGQDVLLPVEHAREVEGLLARVDFELVEEAAHFVPYQQPEWFARRVLAFLAARA
jgi:3-oxoadipate enol-lactonase